MTDAGGALLPDSLVLNRKLPLWYQVAQHLRSTILARPPDGPDRLPTEDDLATHYRVSVTTMRQALKSLEQERIIVRRRRHGTFVAPLTAASHPLTVLGSVDTVVAQQASAEVVVLRRAEMPVPADLADHFAGIDRVVFFRRLRTTGGEPVSCADNWLRPEHAARIESERLGHEPMTQALRDQAGVRIARVENLVEAQLATPELVELLDIALLSPVLLCTGISYDHTDRVIDVARIRYRGDRFKYAVTLRAD